MKNYWQYIVLFPLFIVHHIFIYLPIFFAALAAKMTNKSNCYFWSYKKWNDEGGSIQLVKSKYGWWVHTRHIDKNGIVREYVPHNKKTNLILPPAMFDGIEVTVGEYKKIRPTEEK